MTDLFTWESTPAVWRCCYDPEGLSGFGATKADALTDLVMQIDDLPRTRLLAHAIVRERDEWKEATAQANAAIEHYQAERDKSAAYAEQMREALVAAERAFLADAEPPYTSGDERIYTLRGHAVGSALQKVRAALAKNQREGQPGGNGQKYGGEPAATSGEPCHSGAKPDHGLAIHGDATGPGSSPGPSLPSSAAPGVGKSPTASVVEALELLLRMCEDAAPGAWRNGVVADNGIDEGDVMAGRVMERVRTALDEFHAMGACGWIPVSASLPPKRRTVLIAFKNSHDKWRITRGFHVGRFEMVDESDDPSETGAEMNERGDYYVPEGWNEEAVGAEFFYPISETVTHWQPLPAAPVDLLPMSSAPRIVPDPSVPDGEIRAVPKCICNSGFGMNLSCPLHGVDAPPPRQSQEPK
jgi:hypothetical protein